MTAGQPPKYKDPQKLAKKIQDYFDNGIRVKTIAIGSGSTKQTIKIPVPTITGMCYHLGFESRQSFYDYAKRDKFSYIIKRARLFIEREYEENLQHGNVTGAIFALKNMGWLDRVDNRHSFNMEEVDTGI